MPKVFVIFLLVSLQTIFHIHVTLFLYHPVFLQIEENCAGAIPRVVCKREQKLVRIIILHMCACTTFEAVKQNCDVPVLSGVNWL